MLQLEFLRLECVRYCSDVPNVLVYRMIRFLDLVSRRDVDFVVLEDLIGQF